MQAKPWGLSSLVAWSCGALLVAGCAIKGPSKRHHDDDDSGGYGGSTTSGSQTGAGGDSCGDGVISGAEECDGDNLGSLTCADFGYDSGALGCTAQCVADASSCGVADEDMDGLSVDEEIAAGTDPLNADTDGDGFGDGEEVQAQTDPLNYGSWPQATGAWPDRREQATAAGIQGSSSMSTGNVAPNLSLTDQYGNSVRLHQFYGYAVVISMGAVWCGPCQQAAGSSQHLWDQHREDGVIFIELLMEGQGSGSNPNGGDLNNWANNFELEYPVTYGSPQTNVSSYPTFVFIDKNMVVNSKQIGFPGDSAISSKLNQLK